MEADDDGSGVSTVCYTLTIVVNYTIRSLRFQIYVQVKFTNKTFFSLKRLL